MQSWNILLDHDEKIYLVHESIKHVKADLISHQISGSLLPHFGEGKIYLEARRLLHYSVVQGDAFVERKTVHVYNIHAAFKNWTANRDNPSPFANVSRKHMEFVAENINAVNVSDFPVLLALS